MDLIARAHRLESLAGDVGEPQLAQLCASVRERFTAGNTLVVVCGEFNRGKSSLLNTLLGTDLPTDILPTTAVLHVVCRGECNSLEAVWRDGPPTTITSAELDAFRAGGAALDRVRFIRVGVAGSDLLDAGAVFVDTPGVNDLNAQRVEVTHEFLPQADVALFLLDAGQAVTRSEAEFLTERLWQIPGQIVIFVLNKIDQLDEDERVESLEASRSRLREVTGRELTVMPVSPRTGEGIDELRAEIFRAVAVARAQASQLLQRRLEGVTGTLLERVAGRQALLGATAAELETRRAGVAEAERVARERQGAFFRYVQAFGRDSLVPMVRQSLSVLRADLDEDLVEMLARAQDPNAFLSRDVPSMVHRHLRSWVEHKQPEVNAYLRQFNSKVAQEIQRAFQTPLDDALLGANTTLVRARPASAGVTSAGGGQSDFLIGMGMKAAAGGIVMLLAGPLAPVAAMVGYGLADMGNQARTTQKIAQRRIEVGSVLAGTVGGLFAQYEQAVVGGLEGFFSTTEDAVHDHLEVVLARAHQTMADALREVSESDTSRIRELARYRQVEEELRAVSVLSEASLAT